MTQRLPAIKAGDDVVDLLEGWHQHIVNLVVFPRVFTIMSQATVPADGE
jgi:hypothetical protein